MEHARDGPAGRVHYTRAPWAIARVLSDLALRHEAVWVASAVTDVECEFAQRGAGGVNIELAPGRWLGLRFVKHSDAVWSAVEHRLSSDMLWALTNYVWDMWQTPSFDRDAHAAWDALGAFSEGYAQVLAAVARDGAPDVLLHDYQLVLVPAALRRRMPDVRLLLHLHTPWPSPDYLRILPPELRRTVLRGMLGASVVGFLARRWTANFLACIDDTLADVDVDAHGGVVRHAGGTTRVATIPLGYSAAALEAARARLPAGIVAWAGERPLVVHYGRTDPIKNGPRCIRAFTDVARSSELPADARLLLRITNHRLDVSANRRYRDELLSAAAAANAVLGREAVRCMDDGDHGLTLACLRRADAVVLNSTIDGQNLTAFESALVGGTGTLILSETTGAAEILRDVAVLISPFDLSELGREIVAALRLSADRRAAAAERRASVARRFDSGAWIEGQLTALRSS